jgi:hypothetical protein
MNKTYIAAMLVLCTTVGIASTAVQTDSIWMRGRTVAIAWNHGYTDSICVDVFDVTVGEYRRMAIVPPGTHHVAIEVPWYIEDGTLVRPVLRTIGGTLLAASRYYAVVTTAATKVVAPGGEDHKDSVVHHLFVDPNPATEVVNIRFGDHAGSELRVTDAYGRHVVRTTIHAGTPSVSMPCSSWPVGVYRVELDAAGKRRGASVVVVR